MRLALACRTGPSFIYTRIAARCLANLAQFAATPRKCELARYRNRIVVFHSRFEAPATHDQECFRSPDASRHALDAEVNGDTGLVNVERDYGFSLPTNALEYPPFLDGVGSGHFRMV